MIGFSKKKFLHDMKSKKKIAIQLKNLSKMYQIHHQKPTFAEQFLRRDEVKSFTALNNINLTIYEGEKIGIIGANGSGKTTFLKIVSGISTPSKGKVFTHGKIVSLIDLSAGFHPDLTGHENIFLNGLVIGMSKNDIKSKYRQIIDFADIGGFIDAPLYTYSEGMKLRLAFSIAIHADPDILTLDEGVAAGDKWFRKKAEKRLKEFFKKKTVLLVSHWTQILKENCQKFIIFEKGQILDFGDETVLDRYNQMKKAN
jgi:ABC-type polysaccharide/polyol phosphate transport system ATPase subunit